MSTPYDIARKEGYSDDEIKQYLSQKGDQQPTKRSDAEKYQQALEEGYDEKEIDQFLRSKQPAPQRAARKTGRLAMQAGLATAERALLPYELAVAPLASEEAQQVPYRENLFQDIERLQEQKASGVWDEEDQELYDYLVDQVKSPEKAAEHIQTADIGTRGLFQKATGIDAHPEGILEKAVNWTAFIKNPTNVKSLINAGLTPKNITKSLLPTGKEALRGLSAGTALQMAEEAKFGPIGTMLTAVVGDIAAHNAPGALKSLGKGILSPKQTTAKAIGKLNNLFSPAEKLDVQKQIIQDFRKAGIQADIGTITNNPLIQSMQARLAASGLTGEAFDKFKQELTQEVVGQYKKVADTLGEAKFSTTHEAAELGKEELTRIRDADATIYRELYKDARELGKGKSAVFGTPKLAGKIAQLEADLAPGAVKSPSTKKVLEELENLKKDLYDQKGELKPASVSALINNKINLNDIVDYDVQGGTKSLLKGIVKDIDHALQEYGATQDQEFLKKYVGANKKFEQHAKSFRSDNVNKILTSEDPTHVLKKMDSVQGIKDVRRAFETTGEGKKFFNDLGRLKMDEMIQKNMVSGTTNQLNTGTFANVLEKGKNREIIKELLSPESYKELVKLQKNVGKLNDSAQKFYNASKSGTVVIDASILNKVANIPLAVAGVVSGNPWLMLPYANMAILKTLSKWMTDPKFLRTIEDVVLAGEKGSVKGMQKVADKLSSYAKEIAPAGMLQVHSKEEIPQQPE